jgi:hypothetical protein
MDGRAARRERWAALAVLGFASAALVEARRLPFGSVSVPGAGFFPLTLSAGLALLGTLLVVRAFTAPPTGAAAFVAPGGRARMLTVVVALFAYAAALGWLGFALTTFALMVVLFRVVESHGWPRALVESAAAAALSHVVFKTWLGVRLPPGPWGF